MNIKEVVSKKTKDWILGHQFQLILFNLIIVFLFLLRSAGYFHPYFVISVNFIVLISLFAAVFLLGARSRAIFSIALMFWLFAGLIKVLKVDIWAERTGVYAFQSMVLGVILLILESIESLKRKV